MGDGDIRMASETPPKKPRKSRAKPVAAERPRGGVRAVSDLLPDIGAAAFRRFGFVQSSIVSRWAEIVGERYARVSTPESIRFPHGERANGVLTLTVEGAHGTMMQHISPEIIDRVNRFFGYVAVAKVAFRQGDVRRDMPRPKKAAEPALVPADLGDSLRAIVDPELKAVLEALAIGVSQPQSIPKIGKIN